MNTSLKKVDCTDIYTEETEKSLKTLKRFREAWLRSSSGWNLEIFQYADPDFYFYRFAIDRQERSTKSLLTSIMYRVMERYGLSFDVPDDRRNVPFSFIMHVNDQTLGYKYDDFYENEDVNAILENYNVDSAFIIRTWKAGRSDEWIARENAHYLEDGAKVQAIKIEDFFNTYFAEGEYDLFIACMDKYLKMAREITGYKSIGFLSSMNLAAQKVYEEKVLADWEYDSYHYQIIDSSNKKIRQYLYLSSNEFPKSTLHVMSVNYLDRGLFKTMIGSNEYAESFITSEWLFHSLDGKKNFDYTSVISGYLKSIEQLLHTIVMVNVDNNCKISMSRANNIREKAYDNAVRIFENRGGAWNELFVNTKKEYRKKSFPYIDLTHNQIEYMDSSIGTFEFFLRNNPHIFIDPSLSDTIADMVCCFRIECRNGYFHTHNLDDWSVVEKTRANAIYLYFVLLGVCIIPLDKEAELKMSEIDRFDELCKKIREFRHFNTEFIFEYDDGRKLNLIYDFINNTIEYTDDGIEHYVSLLFYSVDEFSLEAYEKFDAGIMKEQKVYLTRDTLPSKIYGVHRDHNLEEIVF